MQDVSIDWQPVPGAMYYQLQVGKDPDFNNIVDDADRRWARASSPATPTTTTSTTGGSGPSTPPATGCRGPTAAPFVFQRNWPQAPQLEWPPNQLVASRRATRCTSSGSRCRTRRSYQLDISADAELLAGPVLHLHHHRHHVPDRLAAHQRELLRLARARARRSTGACGPSTDPIGRAGDLLQHQQVRLRHRTGHPDLAGRRRHRRRADPVVEPGPGVQPVRGDRQEQEQPGRGRGRHVLDLLDAGEQARPRDGSLHLDRRVDRRLGRRVAALLRDVVQPVGQRPAPRPRTR